MHVTVGASLGQSENGFGIVSTLANGMQLRALYLQEPAYCVRRGAVYHWLTSEAGLLDIS